MAFLPPLFLSLSLLFYRPMLKHVVFLASPPTFTIFAIYFFIFIGKYMKSRNFGIVSLFIAFLLLFLTSLSSCNNNLNTKEYKGQLLSRYMTVLSNRTYITNKNEKVGWNDTLAIFVDNQGKAILVNDIPVNESLPDSENVRPNWKEDYEYNYDAHGHMISATTTWTDTPEYKYIWKDSLVTDVIVTGDYYGNTQHKHIVYDMTVNSPRSGIALFMSLFDTSILMAKYLTGEIGGYVPSHPIAKIYVYNDKYKNDTLTFTNEFDGKNRLTAYTVKSHTTNVSRHFDYPD